MGHVRILTRCCPLMTRMYHYHVRISIESRTSWWLDWSALCQAALCHCVWQRASSSPNLSFECLSPVKLCHYLFSKGVTKNSTNTAIKRKYAEEITSDWCPFAKWTCFCQLVIEAEISDKTYYYCPVVWGERSFQRWKHWRRKISDWKRLSPTFS